MVQNDYGRITLSDTVLQRVEQLKAVVKEASENLVNRPFCDWTEGAYVTLKYGKDDYEWDENGKRKEIPEPRGPVVTYDKSDGRLCRDTTAEIIISPSTVNVRTGTWDGHRDALDYDMVNRHQMTFEELPEVHIHDEFLRDWCTWLHIRHMCFSPEVADVVADMPPEHRKILDQMAEEYYKRNRDEFIDMEV